MRHKKLGEILQDFGQISSADLQKLVQEQESKKVRLGELILQRGLVDKPSLVKALETVSRVPYLDCTAIDCDPPVLRSIPKSMAVRLDVLPVRQERARLVVAMAEPQNIVTIDDLRFATGKDISPRFGFRAEIHSAIARNYDHIESIASARKPAKEAKSKPIRKLKLLSASARQAGREGNEEIQAGICQIKPPAFQLLSEVIDEALDRQASEIHIEPQAAATALSIRVDGVLLELDRVSRGIKKSLVTCIKTLSDMDIRDDGTPQDGRFRVALGLRYVIARVSSQPTQYGEKVVMRLFEGSAPIPNLAELGISPGVADQLMQALALPQGMLLVAGPAGSGRSTTLYSVLNLLRKRATNIATVEDSVEYVLPGINQVQVNPCSGLTFASCLSSVLGRDPNIIMIGEIRDQETAERATKAAQTGRIVLSTLHTNDSISALTRLLGLGIPEYLIASSVTGILAQRLVRKLCACHIEKQVWPDLAEQLTTVGWTHPPDRIPWPEGCGICGHTGYKGQVGIFEFLCMGELIRSILHGGYKLDLVRTAARATGMRRMQQDALEKLKAGVTSLEEIIRVVPMEGLFAPVPKCCDPDQPRPNGSFAAAESAGARG